MPKWPLQLISITHLPKIAVFKGDVDDKVSLEDKVCLMGMTM